MQATYVARALSDRIQLPTEEFMQADVDHYYKRLKAAGVPERYALSHVSGPPAPSGCTHKLCKAWALCQTCAPCQMHADGRSAEQSELSCSVCCRLLKAGQRLFTLHIIINMLANAGQWALSRLFLGVQ